MMLAAVAHRARMLLAVSSLVLVACSSDGGASPASSRSPSSSVEPARSEVLSTGPGSSVAPDAASGATIAPATDVEAEPSSDAVTTVADRSDGIGTRMVEHAYGTTEVPADPQRIVALSEEFLLADLLALGVRPVASTSNGEDTFPGVDPRLTEGIEVLPGFEIDAERIAALQPDLLMAYPIYVELVGYDLLSQIAPTVVLGDVDDDWDRRFAATAHALGLDGELDRELTDIDAQIAAAKESLVGTRVSALSIWPGPFIRAYTTDDMFLTKVLADVGVELVPGDAVDADDNGRIELSLERLDVLSGDVILLLQSDGPGADDERAAFDLVSESPLWATLPAVRSGRVVTLDRLGYPGADGAGRFATDLANALEETTS